MNTDADLSTMDDASRLLLDEGLAASSRGDVQHALSLFAQAAQAQPGWALPHFMIASEQAALGEWTSAENAFAQALLLQPAFHLARYQLGLLQFSGGRAAQAMLTWQPLAQQAEPAWMGDFVLGFAALAADDFAQARSHFERGLAAADVNPAAAGDIRQVLARMPGEPAPATHVLLAGYNRFGPH